MASADLAVVDKPKIINFRSPGTVISRFVFKRTFKAAAFWALVFGVYVASKAVGIAAAYPTVESRARLSQTFGNNIGLNAMLGASHGIQTVSGFAAWNTLMVMVMIGSVWAFLLSTKTFRGEEDSGRWEALLSGQTTPRLAATNVLAGLGASLAVLYVVAAAVFILVGKAHGVNYSESNGLFFALAASAGAIMFMAIGSLISQLMPTRARAAAWCGGIFGVFFLIRATADISNATWLLNVSPLGWVEKLKPLQGSQPIWLLPIFGLALLTSLVSVYFAGKRDLGESIIADKDSAMPKTRFLNNPLGLAFRMTRNKGVSWILTITLAAFFMGLLTKSAGLAFQDSASVHHIFNRLTHIPNNLGETLFLGVGFFIVMILVMCYVVSAVGSIREDEAEGFLDNLLVRTISRQKWIWGRLLLVIGFLIDICVISGVGIWLGTISQHVNESFHALLLADINAMVPAIFILGVCVFAFGVIPRFTTLIGYSILAWSLLIYMASSGITVNHWLLDLSLFHQVNLAPATNSNWSGDLTISIISIVLCIVGAILFNRRDLASE